MDGGFTRPCFVDRIPQMAAKKKKTRRSTGGKDFGTDGHKGGRPPLSDEVKGKKPFNRQDFTRMMNILKDYSIEEIEKLAKSKKTPALRAITAKAILFAWQTGNPRAFQTVTDQLLGKLPDKLDLGTEASLHSMLVNIVAESKRNP